MGTTTPATTTTTSAATTETASTTTKTKTTTTKPTTTTTPATTTTSAATTEITTTTTKPTTTTTPSFDVVCPDSDDGLALFVPHPVDCSKYYACHGSTPVLMECPPGLVFDPALNVCNYPHPSLVDCPAS